MTAPTAATVPGEPTAPATPAVPAGQAPAAAPPAPATPTTAPVDPPADETPAATIARLEADLKSARAEAGKSRVTAKQNAADEARAELAQTIGKALGLVQDEPIDPAILTEQLTAATSQAKQAQIELAIFHAGAAAGADAAALAGIFDSRAFMAKVSGLDPADSAGITAAVTEAIAANPGLVGRRLPAPSPAQGSSAAGEPDLEAQIATAKKAGNFRLVIALENQKLTAPQR